MELIHTKHITLVSTLQSEFKCQFQMPHGFRWIHPRVDHALESIYNIREAFPKLWEADEKNDVQYNGGNVIKITVILQRRGLK